MAKQVIGSILVFAGVAAIGYGILSSYNIFTGKKPVPEIFKLSQTVQQQAPHKQKITSDPQEMLQQQLQQTIQEQLKDMLPAEFISRILNLMSWSIFVGILVLAGGKVSSIGVGLLKN